MAKKKKKKLSQSLKLRWLPTNNTRSTVFKDKKKESNKSYCRDKSNGREEV